jgi:hypothetical protein
MAGEPDHDRSRFVRPAKLTTVRTRTRNAAEYPPLYTAPLQPRDEMFARATTCRYAYVVTRFRAAFCGEEMMMIR